MSPTGFGGRLDLLESFRSAVWGNKFAFRRQFTRPSGSNIEYLDFGEHHEAVNSFCHAVFAEKLLVFEEYRAAMDAFKSDSVDYKNGACITGQPGIGKTCFIAYAVVERLREKQPVAIEVPWGQPHPYYLLFTAKSAAIYKGRNSGPLRGHNPPIWAFSDSNDAISTPMPAFKKTWGVRTFQSTSPAAHRWKDWTKQAEVRLYTMDLPSIAEVEDLALILGENMEHMKTLADKWGCVPRLLLQFLRIPGDEKYFEHNVIDAINVATQNPRAVFQAIANHNSSTIPGSSLVFFIRPESKTNRSLHITYVPTEWLTHQVADGLRCQQEDVRTGFFDVMMTHLQTCSALSLGI